MPAPYPDQRRKARESIKMLFQNPATVRIIHYSCESFDDRENGQSPRVTSIAVRELETGQTESFSIHIVAEEEGVAISNIDAHYDRLEKEMLRRFYDYLAKSTNLSYIHWNMRDANYGFTALEHRFRVLGGHPVVVPEHKRFDLARMLQQIYGAEYIGHPRLEKLAEKNGMTGSRFRTGEQEANLFTKKEYVSLHQSTLRKVDLIGDIAERTNYGTLKTNSNWWVQNGGSLRGAINWFATNAIISMLIALLGLIAGVAGTLVALRSLSH